MPRTTTTCLLLHFLCWLQILSPACAALQLFIDDNVKNYWIVNHLNQTVFRASPIAIYYNQRFCSVSDGTLKLRSKADIYGSEKALGKYQGLQVHWDCFGLENAFITRFKLFSNSILFETTWDLGAAYETPMEDRDAVLTQFPSLEPDPSLSKLSWHGSFVQSIHDQSKGPEGGPTIFYDKEFENVFVGSWWGGNWKSASAGRNSHEYSYWSPGTSGRILNLPINYTQSILLYQAKPASGIVGGMYEWGQVMQKARRTYKVPDVTLQKIGYQTDNGAYYCFCKEPNNCSVILLQTMEALYDVGIGYLSFQGAGASNGRGQAAPWCVSKWGVDGGLGPQFPMPLTEFHRALRNLPMQYYAPYFCPKSSYFDSSSRFQSVASDPTLPGCQDFAFLNVHPGQSKEFYGEFFDRGMMAGMVSFESDFMNQNYNCVPDFISSIDQSELWMQGMTEAALERNLTIQWCYAAPTDVLASLDFPSVTNFRVSFDFCYGQSWNIGESSLLVWALGVKPSKDTLWTSLNYRTATPGCTWTPDHEVPAIELHAVLALMSTGPVGISDAFYQTNNTIVRKMVTSKGDLLQPSRAIVAVDSTFVDPVLKSGDGGYVYGTSALGQSWIFVSFKLKRPYQLLSRDFWPRISGTNLVYRQEQSNEDNFGIKKLTLSDDIAIELPASDFSNVTGGTDLGPSIIQVWEPCDNLWTLLGELDKYVPLSPNRFEYVTCLDAGVKTMVHLRFKETVTVYAMTPNARVVNKTLHAPRGGMVVVQFGDDASES